MQNKSSASSPARACGTGSWRSSLKDLASWSLELQDLLLGLRMPQPLCLAALMLCTVACTAVGGQGGAMGEGPDMLLALPNAMLARLCLTDSGQPNVCTVMAWKCP